MQKQQKWGFNATRRIAAAMVMFGLAVASGEALATQATGPLGIARYSHTASNLPDGRVLIAGGHRTSGSLSSMTTSAELYDPLTGTTAATGAMAVARGEQASATLADGRVLVLGGLGTATGTATSLASAELYDPASGTWNTTGGMALARRHPIALTLADGRVLVIGGDATQSLTEVYDPLSGSFSSAGNLVASRGSPAAALLADGRVLLVGGYPASGGSYYASAEIWNPATATWTLTGSMAAAHAWASATTLPNGKVLIAGGNAGSSFPAAAELYDPLSGTFSLTGALNVPRQSHVAIALSDGNVLISGGTASTWIVDATDEVYDVASGLWRAAGTMLTARNSHTLARLANGTVLISGGLGGPTAGEELFFPACVGISAVLMPTAQSFTAMGGSGSVSVNAPAACGWSVARVPAWMTVTSGLAGTGVGTVTYSIAAMTTSGGRGATPRIADADFSLSQTGSCSASTMATLSPTGQSFGTAGGSGSIAVTIDAGCGWSVSGVPAWMTITSAASGFGNGTVSYTIASNAGAARSSALLIGNRSWSVTQSGVAPICDPNALPSISPASQSFAAAGGSGSVAVTYAAGCNWSVSGAPSWVTVAAGASGQGNGTVSYTVASNNAAARSASFSIATKSFSVSQSAVVANCDATPLGAGVTASGGLAVGDCTSGYRGTGYYTDRYSFGGAAGQKISLQLSSSAFDTYVYLKNPGGTVISSNDDGGGGTNSRIPATSGSFTLPAGSATGTYVVEVTSYGGYAIGAYTLLYSVY